MKGSFAFFLASAVQLSAVDPVTVTKENAATFYRGFKRLTEKPRLVSTLLLADCRSALRSEIAVAHSPHADKAIHLYANAAAAGAIAEERSEFPEGAIIVKEKLGGDLAVTGIGGMIKRGRGYDRKNGDWEYFYFTPGGGFTSGKLANCIGCHSGGQRDHVFNVWSRGAK